MVRNCWSCGLGAAAVLLTACTRLSVILPATAVDLTNTPSPSDANVASEPNATQALPSLPYLSLFDGQLIINGGPVQLHGFSWYGFSGTTGMVQGNWQENGLSGDMATNVQRMAALGFNTVRLPFAFAEFPNVPPSMVVNPCTLPSSSTLAASVTPPTSSEPIVLRALTAPPVRTSNVCNDYIPSNTALQRFVWTVKFFADNGFYVMIDNHGRDENLAVTDESQWLSDWSNLVGNLVGDANVAERLIIEPVSDPNILGITWQTTTPGLPSATQLYLDAFDTISPLAPHALFFLEGASQPQFGESLFQGFASDPNVVTNPNYSASYFFEQLVTRTYANRVIMAASVFGPTTTNVMAGSSGPALFAHLTQALGYLNDTGYCSGGVCTRFPVMIDAFGSNFSDPNDVQSMNDMAAYITNTGDGADGLHNPVVNWVYWAWNPTGVPSGLVQDDWSTVLWPKIAFLNGIGLPQQP